MLFIATLVKHAKKATGESKIISPEAPKTIFYNSMASNELIAHTLILKYQHAMPLYRQETYFDMMGAYSFKANSMQLDYVCSRCFRTDI